VILVKILVRRGFGSEELRSRVSNRIVKEMEVKSLPSHPRERCETIECLPCGFGYRYEVKGGKRSALIRGSCHGKARAVHRNKEM
jgi:hypothetical protein